MLLDEPWSNVDPHLRGSLRDEVAAILRALDVTVVLVTHDREEAFSLADRIALMRDGTIVQDGTPEELYYAPVVPLGGRVRRRRRTSCAGTVVDGVVETPIGTLPGERLRRSARVEVLVRPELLELDPTRPARPRSSPASSAATTSSTACALDGVELVSQRPSNEVVPLGARVSIHVHDGHGARLPLTSCKAALRRLM